MPLDLPPQAIVETVSEGLEMRGGAGLLENRRSAERVEERLNTGRRELEKKDELSEGVFVASCFIEERSKN